MPLVEGINQYQNSTASNTQALSSVKETIYPASSLRQEMQPGKVFEGTITEIKNGQVTIGLSDGQTMTARLDTGVNLEKGMPMLFEVKYNSGEQIAIRPVTPESAQNPTLLKALEAAGLKVTEQNLAMVNEMMKGQMPIDKTSLMQMARLISNFPDTDIQSMIQMQKAGIEISESSIRVFEQYQQNQQSFLPEVKNLMEGMAGVTEELYSREQGMVMLQNGSHVSNPSTMLGFQQQIAGILMGGQTGAQSTSQNVMTASQSAAAAVQLQQNEMIKNLSVIRLDAAEGVTIHQDLTETESGLGQSSLGGNFMENNLMGGQDSTEMANHGNIGKQEMAEEAIVPAGNEEHAQTGHKTELVLNSRQQENLTRLLQEFSGAVQNEKLLPEGKLNSSLPAGELLLQIISSVENSENYTSASMQRLFHSREYQGLLKQAMEEQWLTTPENLKEEGVVKELYQRLGRQMEQLQQLLDQTGTASGAALAKTAQQVQSNLDFMNQLNQMYTYVQLPLKLQQQNTNSDLYVYTNKKSLRDKEGELSALLHLDMEHLGTTDVHIKLLGTSLETKFYLENEASCQLLLRHIEGFKKRLEEKGYQCRMEVENRKKNQDFVEDFLEQEKSIGRLQRYSFDVKA